MKKEKNKIMDKMISLNATELLKLSDFLNEHYDLETWVQGKTIGVVVWNNALSETVDVEMSKGQVEDFYKEMIKTNRSWNSTK